MLMRRYNTSNYIFLRSSNCRRYLLLPSNASFHPLTVENSSSYGETRANEKSVDGEGVVGKHEFSSPTHHECESIFRQPPFIQLDKMFTVDVSNTFFSCWQAFQELEKRKSIIRLEYELRIK